MVIYGKTLNQPSLIYDRRFLQPPIEKRKCGSLSLYTPVREKDDIEESQSIKRALWKIQGESDFHSNT
jgi:hypothetical protein